MNVTQVRDFLKRCNLLEYYDRFISEGFDQLQSLHDVTEADLIAMNVKRGHRRRLQREIATMKGYSKDMPLFIRGLEDTNEGQMSNNNVLPSHPPNVPPKTFYLNGPLNTNCTPVMRSTTQRKGSTGDDYPLDSTDQPDNGNGKRKYKRHPKRDKNAPVKPLSAYVMFAHKVREEYSGKNVSFPDMAKIVGERWKNIRAEDKESIENEASKKKEEYQAEMAVYKTSESWKKYQEYLKEFKEKYESNPRDSNKRKRPKTTEQNDPSPDSDNATPSGYSSTRSTSVGYDNGSGNTSSGSGNGNGNGHNTSPTRIPPYTHYNPTVPYVYANNNNGQNSGNNKFVTPPPSINTNNTSTTSLADLLFDNNAGDDQSQPGNGSSGNGSGNGSGDNSSSGSSRTAERQSFEDSDNSTASSSNSASPAVFVESDDNVDRIQSRKRSARNQNQHQNNSESHKQDDTKSK